MTRDEILNMKAGREMDALVAKKVMGWDHNHKINECEDGWYSYCEYCGYEPRFEEVEPGECDTPPRYSTDIAAAWEVVEKLQQEPREWYFECHRTVAIPPGHYHAFFGGTIGYADTAPRAICIAACLAVWQDDPEICPKCGSDLGHRVNCPDGIAFTGRKP